MADTLLHITLADAALARLNKDSTKVLSNNAPYYHLGAALVDLPYHDHLIHNGLRKLRDTPLTYHPVGEQLHQMDAVPLIHALFESTSSDKEFALTAGMLTHYVVDIHFHKFIEATINEHPQLSHGWLEDQMGLYAHFDLLGHSGIGTPYSGTALAILPTENWTKHVTQAMSCVLVAPPIAEQWIIWLRKLRIFGHLCRTRHAPWVKTVPNEMPRIHQTTLALTDLVIEKSAQLLESACQVFTGRDQMSEFFDRLEHRRMTDGALIT